MMRRRAIAAVVIVALVGGGWYYTTYRSQAASAQSQVSYIQVPLRRGEIRSTIAGTGPVASVNGVLVKTSQSGTVAQILAQDGDRVKAGQVIMVLTNESLQASLKQAQIDLQNNQANLDNLLSPQDTAVRAQQLKVENARLTLQQRQKDVASLRVTAPRSAVVASVKATEGSDVSGNALLFTLYDDETPTFTVGVPQAAAAALKAGQKATVSLPGFGAVEGTVEQTGAPASPGSGNRDATVPVAIALPALPGVRAGMVGQASIVAEGLTYLIQANGTVENDAVEVRAQVQGTVADLAVREGDRVAAGSVLAELANESLQIQLKQAENDLRTQEQNLTNLINPGTDPSGQLRTAMSKLEQSLVTVSSRQRDVDDLQVKAPVDGVISSLTPRIGDRVDPKANIFRVADYNMMQITITVDELDIAKARVGQKAQVTLDALPGKAFQGTVTKINPEGLFKNDIATFEVTVTVQKPEGLLAGMNSTVNIVVEEKQQVLWLPAQTVRVQQGKALVQVLENEKPVQKEVQVGLRTSQQVEITGGLNEGAQVIATVVRPQTASGLGGIFGGNRNQQNQPSFPAEGNAPAGGTNANPQQRQQQRNNSSGGR